MNKDKKTLDSTVNPNKYKGKYSAVSLINPIAVDKKGDIMKRELGNRAIGAIAVPQTVDGEK